MAWLRDVLQRQTSTEQESTSKTADKTTARLYYAVLISMLGFLGWVVHKLDAAHTCGILQATKNPEACTVALTLNNTILGNFGYGFIGVILTLTLVMGVREFKVHAKVDGPANTGLELGNDPIPVEVKNSEPIPVERK